MQPRNTHPRLTGSRRFVPSIANLKCETRFRRGEPVKIVYYVDDLTLREKIARWLHVALYGLALVCGAAAALVVAWIIIVGLFVLSTH